MNAPFPWFGGKHYEAATLLPLLPPHEVYVEPYGGSAALLFAKPQSKLEVYNDLDSGLVNFYRVLRNRQQAKELQRILELTPYSREEYLMCRDSWQAIDDPVEMARRWYVTARQSFSATTGQKVGWSASYKINSIGPRKFASAIDGLSQCARRFRCVQVEQQVAVDLITKYDAPNVLFYVDPPYAPSTRSAIKYSQDTDHGDHVRLLETLLAVRGMVVLSGYRSPLYDKMLHGWRRTDQQTVNWSSNTKRPKRVECIWLSPNATRHQPELPFEATA